MSSAVAITNSGTVPGAAAVLILSSVTEMETPGESRSPAILNPPKIIGYSKYIRIVLFIEGFNCPVLIVYNLCIRINNVHCFFM
ncbi:hypothetical protein EO157G_5230 [Escherichia phage SP27]|uniref:Uncharacterized protein n=1 Tax=Escherichia phage SP27 TaxID=2495557 RepID=A0A5A4U6M6_9CAUD|nr:hypothetical protein EO157G_5230 [Escherichia phage SP27]